MKQPNAILVWITVVIVLGFVVAAILGFWFEVTRQWWHRGGVTVKERMRS